MHLPRTACVLHCTTSAIVAHGVRTMSRQPPHVWRHLAPEILDPHERVRVRACVYVCLCVCQGQGLLQTQVGLNSMSDPCRWHLMGILHVRHFLPGKHESWKPRDSSRNAPESMDTSIPPRERPGEWQWGATEA